MGEVDANDATGTCPAPWLLSDEELQQAHDRLAQVHADYVHRDPDLPAVTRELVGPYIDRAHRVYDRIDHALAAHVRPGEQYQLHSNHQEVSDYYVPTAPQLPWNADVTGYYALNSFTVDIFNDGQVSTVELGGIDLRGHDDDSAQLGTPEGTWSDTEILTTSEFAHRWDAVGLVPD